MFAKASGSRYTIAFTIVSGDPGCDVKVVCMYSGVGAVGLDARLEVKPFYATFQQVE